MNLRMRSTGAWVGAAWAVALWMPSQLQACATCFGEVDSQMARGSAMGVLVLMLVVVAVLGGILSAGLVLVSRARRCGEAEEETETMEQSARAGRHGVGEVSDDGGI